MNEVDDRLAGDPVWELFPQRAAGPARGPRRTRYARWLAVACLVAVIWPFSPALGVLIACLAVAAGDFRYGRQLARSIPDKAGGAVCARFTYAWGAWKLGMTAFAFAFATACIAGRKSSDVPPGFVASLLLCLHGWLLSAVLTAAGLGRAYRSGMRVWVGEGVNQARTLLLAMLIVGFTVAVLGPMGVWLAASAPSARDSGDVVRVSAVVGAMFALMLLSPVVMLVVLDRLSRRIVADSPGKFGPRVPAVGKRDS
jgi:hypothetical protein